MTRATPLLVLALTMAACNGSPTGPSDLAGAAWRLVSIDRAAGSATVVTSPERYTLEFLSDGRVAVRADCNVCSGSFRLAGETLTIDALACTRAFCGDASLDADYTRALAGPLSASRDQLLLVLRGSGVTLRFRSF